MSKSIDCEQPNGLLRYVVLHHRPFSAGVVHFDWMFENGESLLTWATDSLPSRTSASTVPANKLPDHRAVYLTYEGPLSDNRGDVSQVEKGYCKAICIQADHCKFELTGDLAGTLSFKRNQRGVDATWTWSFRPTRADAS